MPFARVLIAARVRDHQELVSIFSSAYSRPCQHCLASMKGKRQALAHCFLGDLALSAEIAYHFATVGEEPIARQRLGELTKELEIPRLISCGYSMDRIATDLGITEKTVQARRNKLRRKLKVDNDVELCLLALNSGCTPLHEAAKRVHAPP